MTPAYFAHRSIVGFDATNVCLPLLLFHSPPRLVVAKSFRFLSSWGADSCWDSMPWLASPESLTTTYWLLVAVDTWLHPTHWSWVGPLRFWQRVSYRSRFPKTAWRRSRHRTIRCTLDIEPLLGPCTLATHTCPSTSKVPCHLVEFPWPDQNQKSWHLRAKGRERKKEEKARRLEHEASTTGMPPRNTKMKPTYDIESNIVWLDISMNNGMFVQMRQGRT